MGKRKQVDDINITQEEWDNEMKQMEKIESMFKLCEEDNERKLNACRIGNVTNDKIMKLIVNKPINTQKMIADNIIFYIDLLENKFNEGSGN